MIEMKDGKPFVTKEDIEQIIKDSYDEGFEDGRRFVTAPITIPNYYPNAPSNPNDLHSWEPNVTYCNIKEDSK